MQVPVIKKIFQGMGQLIQVVDFINKGRTQEKDVRAYKYGW